MDLTVRNFRLSRVRSTDVLPLAKIYVDSNGGGNVVDYPGNNSLVVSGSAAIMGGLSEFITSIDVARQQVLIQSLMFETTMTNGAGQLVLTIDSKADSLSNVRKLISLPSKR